MAKYLVIVESPAKVKTIQKFLGANYTVAASNGHVRDLPKSSLGIDVENDYEVMVLVAEKEAINDFENTERVHDVTEQRTGAGRSFVYEAPACSVSVLKLEKK